MKSAARFVFDFDRTLFNDDAFMSDLVALLKGHGISDEALLNSYATLKIEGILWSPYQWVLRALGSIPLIVISDIEQYFLKTYKYIYDDVAPTLESMGESKIILSHGDEDTQKRKIKHSGLEKYFDHVVITSDAHKTSEFSKLPRKSNVVFIDDRGPIIDAVKQAYPMVTCIRIMRPGSAYNYEESLYADRVITSLNDLKQTQ